MDKKKLLSHILETLKARGADEAECSLTDTVKTEVYYEQKKIGLIRTNFNSSLAVKALKDKKKGTVSLNSLDDESVEQAINDVMELVNVSVPDPDEGISEIAAKEDFSTGVLEADTEAIYTRLREFIDTVAEKYPKISFDSVTAEHDYVNRLYMNTNGTELSEEDGAYSFSPMFMAVDGENASSFNATGCAFRDISKPLLEQSITESSLADSEKQIYTKPIEGKFVGEVILTPSCLESIIYTIVGLFLSDSALIEGTSPYKDSLGQKVADEKLTLSCQPRNEELIGYAVTSDGYVAENMTVFENGVLKNFILSRYGAKKTGRTRSANSGDCFVMEPGDIKLEDMIKNVKRGIIVDRFSGGSPSADGLFSGVAKNSFLIEDGKITSALSETMISGNLTELLNSIKEISAERDNNGSRILPWIKADGITITGQ